MHIEQVTIKNFRCFEHLEVKLNPDVNVFVGNNGSGKSALLDAIAAALLPYAIQMQLRGADKQNKDSRFKLENFRQTPDSKQKNQYSEIRVITSKFSPWITVYTNANQYISSEILPGIVSGSEFFSEIQENINCIEDSQDGRLSIFAYYSESRLLNTINPVEAIAQRSFNRFDSLNYALNATSNFQELASWFISREFQELQEARARKDISFELSDLRCIRNAISTVIPNTNRVFSSQTLPSQLMAEVSISRDLKEEFELTQLSAGYRIMLALVMDFSQRLAQANPSMDNPLEAEAILMIDEIDLHLHPKWQQRIIPALRKVFPNTQLMVTTHSPEVVTTVEQHQVFLLENYQIKDCPSPTRGMKSSEVVRYVMGLDDLRPETEEKRTLIQLFDAIDNGDIAAAKHLREELKSWESFDSDLTRADMQIRRLERRASA